MASRGLTLIQNMTAISIGSYMFNHFVCSAVLCSGPSMQPTLRTDDLLLTEQVSVRMGWIDIGDIVVSRVPDPAAGTKCVCKRVVAQSGDLVHYQGKTIKVPEKHLWLEGDNKNNSMDSRNWGPVPISLIRRRCICRLWPNFDLNFGSHVNYHLEASGKGNATTK